MCVIDKQQLSYFISVHILSELATRNSECSNVRVSKDFDSKDSHIVKCSSCALNLMDLRYTNPLVPVIKLAGSSTWLLDNFMLNLIEASCVRPANNNRRNNNNSYFDFSSFHLH